MRNFYNGKEDIVSEALDGLVVASGGRLVRFDRASHARVVMRGDWDKTRVAIVSGGGSGHEPSHAGLVGVGLLTAAVCGEVFASPSVDAVLSAILSVTGAAGCLLIVKNYTGDRLNFGLAAERAKALGLRVEIAIVADDIAIPDAVQPRGTAGTVFIHKIAGHLSEAGGSLEEIIEAVERAKPGVLSIGVARDTCTLPETPKQSRIAPEEVEIGLGIHGEAGVDLARPSSSAELVDLLVARLVPLMTEGGQYALLFNNLGGLSGLECAVLLGDVMQSRIAEQIKYISGPAAVMTALDMPGFSLSLLALSPDLERILLAPTGCQAFPAFRPVCRITSVAAPAIPVAERHRPSTDAKVRRILDIITTTCIEMKNDINALDAMVGDGDTGSTFASAAYEIRRSLDDLPLADGAALLSTLGDIKRRSMGGSSGVLFAILLASASESFRWGGDWIEAFGAGLAAMQKYGGAQLGDRTMVDALEPMLDAFAAGAGLEIAAKRARAGANATGTMAHAGAGRSSYLDARTLRGVNDPGAEAVARIMEALAKASAEDRDTVSFSAE